ncbi:MAG: DEAD/DEAH box helicase family protein [Prevotellaceae bacterium]|nr:DEAD/DEAH box helicase family protein [Prevotellaceae bacterium]
MVSKETITIDNPDLKYLSQIELETGKPFRLPHGILSKGLTGNGGTTMALLDREHHTIVASPRIMLLKNKHEQMPGTLLVTGDTADFQITDYLDHSELKKVLVTFDSLPRVLENIPDMEGWHVVIDEFQFVMSDATFKCDTELRLLQVLKDLPYVTYLSATPNYDRYLEQLEFFKDLPYTEVRWPHAEKTHVIRRKVNKPILAAQKIVEDYKNGRFISVITESGEKLESRECVIFLNSVKNIINIVKNTGLSAEQVNIVVANKEDNLKAIQQLGEGYELGRIPLEGEPHKLVTLCTSTAYAGCDFMSECASTFVVSDCHQSHTSTDIHSELVQIAGRQRLKRNPFHNVITFIYNTSADDSTREEYIAGIERRVDTTNKIIELYNRAHDDEALTAHLRRRELAAQRVLKYKESYAVYDETEGKWVFNNLALLAEIWTYNVQHEQYSSGLFIMQSLAKTERFVLVGGQGWQRYEDQVDITICTDTFKEQMEQYCQLRTANTIYTQFLAEDMEYHNPELKEFFDALGAERIKALSHQRSKIVHEYKLHIARSSLLPLVQNAFHDGQRLTVAEIKQKVQEVYDANGFTDRKAQTKDVEMFGFRLKDCKIAHPDGKRISGKELCRIETD